MKGFIIAIVLVLVVSFILFYISEKSLEKSCNGRIIGEEIGGQNRDIYLCQDGALKIF
jgi:hypothetical protein